MRFVHPTSRRSADGRALRFLPLPGTAQEVAAVQRFLRGSQLWTGSAASEAALKQVRGPQLLHMATHGFFLADQLPPPPATRALQVVSAALTTWVPVPLPENPLLRAGLALAGANAPQSGTEDGLLTALEVAGLDLWGTELVVLSACDTGGGQVRNGEGVYGLRRALVMAGADSQLMSLWKVDDEATRELMVAYYRQPLGGEGRAEALRQVQLKMLASPQQRHPFYWAAFILSGVWTPLRIARRPQAVRGESGKCLAARGPARPVGCQARSSSPIRVGRPAPPAARQDAPEAPPGAGASAPWCSWRPDCGAMGRGAPVAPAPCRCPPVKAPRQWWRSGQGGAHAGPAPACRRQRPAGAARACRLTRHARRAARPARHFQGWTAPDRWPAPPAAPGPATGASGQPLQTSRPGI